MRNHVSTRRTAFGTVDFMGRGAVFGFILSIIV